MKMPHDGMSFTMAFSMLHVGDLLMSASNMDKILCATTDNTSMLIRLNSSKHPQAPVYFNLKKIINFSFQSTERPRI